MKEDKTIHITKTLTSTVIMDFIDEYPNLEEITCSPSVYDRTSKRYIEALNQLDIKVTKKYNWGAEKQEDVNEELVLKLASDGVSAKDIAEKLDISLNRVYYLLRRNNEKINKDIRKHDYNQVKSLKDEGLSAKEISSKLDIPLRSVYYILNKK